MYFTNLKKIESLINAVLLFLIPCHMKALKTTVRKKASVVCWWSLVLQLLSCPIEMC